MVSGTTSVDAASRAHPVFFLQLSVIGSTMGTREELGRAGAVPLRHRRPTGHRPVLPLDQARAGFAAMAEGDVFGKIVFTR